MKPLSGDNTIVGYIAKSIHILSINIRQFWGIANHCEVTCSPPWPRLISPEIRAKLWILQNFWIPFLLSHTKEFWCPNCIYSAQVKETSLIPLNVSRFEVKLVNTQKDGWWGDGNSEFWRFKGGVGEMEIDTKRRLAVKTISSDATRSWWARTRHDWVDCRGELLTLRVITVTEPGFGDGENVKGVVS